MKFHKRQGDKSVFFIKTLIKVALIFVFVFSLVIFVDKIDFPTPNKKIQTIVPNENFKIIK